MKYRLVTVRNICLNFLLCMVMVLSLPEIVRAIYSAYLAYTNKNDLSTTTTQLSAPEANTITTMLVPTRTSGGYVMWFDTSASILCYTKYFADSSIGELQVASTYVSHYSKPVYYNGKLVRMSNKGDAVDYSFVEYTNKHIEISQLDLSTAEIATMEIPVE